MSYPPITIDIVKDHPDILPWEKYPEETPKAYSAFKMYRDTPAWVRRMKEVTAQLYGDASPSKLRQVYEWSRKFNWVWRTEEWDKHLDEEERREHIKNIKDMRTRHLRVAQALFTQGVARLRLMTEEEIAKLTLPEMFAFLEKGYSMERETIGVESVETEIETLSASRKTRTIAETLNQDFSIETTEELRQILIHRRLIQVPDTNPVSSET